MAKSKTNKPVVVIVKEVNKTTTKSKDMTEKTINKKFVINSNKKSDSTKSDYSTSSPKLVADIIFKKIVDKSKKSVMPSSKDYDFSDADDRKSFMAHVTNVVKSIIDNKQKNVILDNDEIVDLQMKFADLQKQYEEISSTDVKKAVTIGVKLAKAGEELTNAVYLHNCIKTNLYNLTCEFYRRYICNATNGKLWEKLCNVNSDETNFIVNLVCELDRSRFITAAGFRSGVATYVPLVDWLVFAYTTENNSEHTIAKKALERMGYIDFD
jgi:hypothetical protein